MKLVSFVNYLMVRSKQAARKLKKQYYTDNRDSNLKREKQRYSTDQAYREVKIERAKQKIKERYHNDEVYRHAKIDSDKQRYNDEVYRHAKIETAKQKFKESYHNDEDYRIKYKKNQKT